MSARSWITALCALLCALGAHAQTATLLKDINTNVDVPVSAGLEGLTEFNDAAYFFSPSTTGTGRLWRTDGTAAGTQLVRNKVNGTNPFVSGGMLFFAAGPFGNGSELWKSDGTTEGTVLVKDIYPRGIPPFSKFINAAGMLYFEADDGNGRRLWESDGTEAGTVPAPGPDTFGRLLGNIDDTVYFTASDGVNGMELWRTDGTLAGTYMVRDINAGPGSSSIFPFGQLDDVMLFAVDDGAHGKELWRSDGTTAGTALVIDLNPGVGDGIVDPRGATAVYKNKVYFAGANGDGSGSGLWRTDGTLAGTERVRSGTRPVSFGSVASLLYFINDGLFGESDALWKTDGSMAGTAAVREFFNIGPELVSFGGRLYFSAGEDSASSQLWKTNGTDAGTALVSDIGASHPLDSFVVLRSNPLSPGVLLFRADDGVHGPQLWRTDGSQSGTSLVKVLGVEAGDSKPGEFHAQGDELYFTAIGNAGERTQWKTDGTVEGTVPAEPPPLPPPTPRLPGFFAFDDGVSGLELWKTDGTEAGAFLVKNINPGPADGVLESLGSAMIDGTLFFRADDGANGPELWKSDGTEAGTVMVRNIRPGEGGSSPGVFLNLNGTLIFKAASGMTNNELWRSDGTEAGTFLIYNDSSYSSLQTPIIANGFLFYQQWSPQYGFDIWRTDGTAEGTIRLIESFGALVPMPQLQVFGGKLLISLHRDVGSLHEGLLWTSDGTVEGTVAFKTFDPVDGPGLVVFPFNEYNQALYFVVRSPSGVSNLWRSDGTEEGTTQVGDLPPPAASVKSILGSYAGSLFLDVQESGENSSPHHIARTQGTAASTTVDETQFDAFLQSFIGVGSNVFFGGPTEETGWELWTLPLQPAISTNGVVDAAGYLPTLAPGGLASLFGVELAGDTASASGFPLPTTLAGSKLKVNGIDAPLLFVSPTQINFQVPYETPLDASVSVVATLNGQQSLSEPTAVADFAPAIFVNPATGEPIVQRHPDGALITSQNPAQPGDTLVIYLTGMGGLDNPPLTGAAATDSPLATATTSPTVLVGGVEATVLFAGLAPNFAGLGQINIQLPQTLPQGSPLPLTIRFGDSESPTLELPF